MATIRVERTHQLGRQTVRDKVEALAERLSREYQLRCQWRGDQLEVQVRRPSGEVVTASITLAEDPSLVAATVESSGRSLTPAQKAFRDAWLGSKVK